MAGLLALARAIDRVNEFIGKWVSWLILVAVLVSAGNAVIRKAFNMSSNAWLELQWYLFGAAFLLAAAYTLKQNEHIRIDIVYGMFSRRVAALDRPVRARLLPDAVRRPDDLLFHPLCARCPFRSRRSLVQRRRPDHLAGQGAAADRLRPARLQGISEIIKKIAIMRGDMDDPDPVHLRA